MTTTSMTTTIETALVMKKVTYIILCAWCGKHLGTKQDKPSKDGETVSHGICETCKDKLIKEWKK